ncbi:alpha-L-rhamnosidase C-terminal domain-containing protein [Ningiella sp. W23]|uniref:alpha-L-rhamnosidase-related protein n=1 Tax=Ningiella sp. W23 TaxID=3023715 RepID=UPI00375665BA
MASNKTSLNKDHGDVWNSGKIVSAESQNVILNDLALKAGSDYYWKVRVWGQSTYPSRFSEMQSFSLADDASEGITANQTKCEKVYPELNVLGKGHYILDYGRDAFASLDFTYTAETAHTLMFHLGERLKDGAVDRQPQGSIRYQKIPFSVKQGKHSYSLPIDQPESLASQAVKLENLPALMPFRYVEIEHARSEIRQKDAIQNAYFYYWDDNQSDFTSDNAVLNRVWKLCKYSIKATSFSGLYIDGDRERLPYEADAYINQLSHYSCDREYAIARRTIEYLLNNPTWPTEWQLHMVPMVYQDFMYTGDASLIDKYFYQLRHKTLFTLRDARGLISAKRATPDIMRKLGFSDETIRLSDIVDWPPARKRNGKSIFGERDGFVAKPFKAHVNAMHYQNLTLMAEFAKLLGKVREQQKFEYLAMITKNTFNEVFLDRERGIYTDGIGTKHASIHANMFPLAFNLVPKNMLPSVVAHIKNKGMACSVYGAQYLLDALYNANASEHALQLLSSKAERSWYNMIREGATITMEAWAMKFKPNADWNHAWGAAPANIITRRLWGITPLKPGFKVAAIKPQLEGLKTSRITVPTIRGLIEASYSKHSEQSSEFCITIPSNMVAEFSITPTDGFSLRYEGKFFPSFIDYLQLPPGRHNIEVGRF